MVATYTKPTKTPRWADTSTNILEPPELKKDEGWLFEEIPPSAFENWRTNLIGAWAKWLDERLFDGASKDEFLIKCPKDGTDGLLIADTFVKSMKDFRVEGDDLGIEVDGTTSRRVYFDAAKQNWLGYSIGGSRMELYAGGVLAIYADATGTYINGDLNIGDDLSLPGGLAVGIATPTIVDDVIQLGDADNKWDFNSGNPRLYFGSNDFFTYDRATEIFYFYINNAKTLRMSSMGISADGIHAGNTTSNPTNDCVTANLHGIFGGGVAVGTVGMTPPVGSITLGDTECLLRYDVTLPYLQFAAGDQLAYDRTNNLFQFKVATAETVRIEATGLQSLGGLNVGYTGPIVASRINLGSAATNFRVDATHAYLAFDNGDQLHFNRSLEILQFEIASSELMRLSGTGSLGLAIKNGLYVGSINNPTDDMIICEGGIVSWTGISAGISAITPPDDSVCAGDLGFKMQGGATQYLQFAPNDLIGYDRTSDYFYFNINSIEEMRLTASGLAITNGVYVGSLGTPIDDTITSEGNGVFWGGLRVGFSGVPTADRIEIGDAAFYAELATDPYIYFDALDYLQYSRSGNHFDVYVGGNAVARWGATAAELSVPLTLTGVNPINWDAPGADPTAFGRVQTQRYTGKLVSGDGSNTARYLGTIHTAYEINRTSLGVFSTCTIPANTLAAGSRIHAKLRVHGLVGTTSWTAVIKIGGNIVGQCGGLAGAVGDIDVEALVSANPGGAVNTYTSYVGLDSGGASHSIGYQLIGLATNAAVTVVAELTFASGTPSVTLRTFTVDVN